MGAQVKPATSSRARKVSQAQRRIGTGGHALTAIHVFSPALPQTPWVVTISVRVVVMDHCDGIISPKAKKCQTQGKPEPFVTLTRKRISQWHNTRLFIPVKHQWHVQRCVIAGAAPAWPLHPHSSHARLCTDAPIRGLHGKLG
jgi:hypothetical protein